MRQPEHAVEIRTGRRGEDGRVHLSLFTNDMLALTVEGHGDRTPTLLLTLEQSRQLHSALTEFVQLLEEAEGRGTGDLQPPATAIWQGTERRTTGQLNK
ncbi:MAG: hypothetical protein ABR577_03060 [Pyrinomonadaceae bacterium]